MVFLLGLSGLLIPYLLGKSTFTILYGNQKIQDMTAADSWLTGGMLVTGLAEAAHLGAIFLGWSFSDCAMVFCFLTGLAAVMAAAILLWKKKKQGKKGRLKVLDTQAHWQIGQHKLWTVLIFACGLLVLLQLAVIIEGNSVYRQGDLTVEAVNSFLNADGIYKVNPLTGAPYETGIPLRLKILCLPTLYGALCRVFRLPAEQLIWLIVPVFTLIGCCCAYYTISRKLFAEDRVKRMLFLVLAALLLLVGDYMYGMDSFGLLHAGARGTTIRACILLPYTFGLCLRKKWKLVILCVVIEACVVWTFYGLGACFFVGIVMFALQKMTHPTKGEEASACRNS